MDKLQDYQRGKLEEIEKTSERSLRRWVALIVMVKLDHEKDLVMPKPAHCGTCHKQEYEEFESEKQYGIPDWKLGRKSHAKSYDANLDVDVWAAVNKNVVQGCDMCHNIQHKCDSCHTRHAFKASESRRPEAWIEVCVQCHSPRFSRDYLDSMDKASDSIFQYVSDAYATIKSLHEDGVLYPMPENRPKAPAPVTEKYPDLLGGFYGEFWAKDGNPSKIEKDFLYMWENDAFLVRKGLAHMNPNGFTYISWSNLLKKYVDIQSEANTLRRLAALEKKAKLRPSRAQKKSK